eukprot:4734622-Amphidinium_carterae.1
MIRPYEERQREQQSKPTEWKLGQRSWASVVQGPVAIKPEHQHDDHAHDFWELRDDSEEDSPWDTTMSSPQDMETEADEWANQCWRSWWTPDSDDTHSAEREQMEEQPQDDGIDDDWVEKPYKRPHKKTEADKRGRVPCSNGTSEEEHARKQPRKEEAPTSIDALIQELREEKAQLRAENRELRAKLDEVLARLASTGVDGDHYEADITTGQYVLFPRTFAAEVSYQIGLYRHPWQPSLQLAQRSDWDNVSGEGNLCFWRCLLGMLANEGHQDAFLPPEQIKVQVLAHAYEHAGRLAAMFQGLQERYEQAFQHEAEENVMASDKSVLAASDYYGLNITVMFREEQAVWHFVPANQPITHQTHLIWLEGQHFQRGPLADLGAAARHALPVSGGNEARFAGGHVPSSDWDQLLAAEERRHFTLSSCNGNSWTTLDRVLTTLTEDKTVAVLAFQEHRLLKQQLWKLERRAAALGWKAVTSPATKTKEDDRGTSGGTA